MLHGEHAQDQAGLARHGGRANPILSPLATCLALTQTQVREAAGAEERDRVYVTASEVMDLSGSKGTANFVMKFAKGCKDTTMNVQAVKKFTREYTGGP